MSNDSIKIQLDNFLFQLSFLGFPDNGMSLMSCCEIGTISRMNMIALNLEDKLGKTKFESLVSRYSKTRRKVKKAQERLLSARGKRLERKFDHFQILIYSVEIEPCNCSFVDEYSNPDKQVSLGSMIYVKKLISVNKLTKKERTFFSNNLDMLISHKIIQREIEFAEAF